MFSKESRRGSPNMTIDAVGIGHGRYLRTQVTVVLVWEAWERCVMISTSHPNRQTLQSAIRWTSFVKLKHPSLPNLENNRKRWTFWTPDPYAETHKPGRPKRARLSSSELSKILHGRQESFFILRWKQLTRTWHTSRRTQVYVNGFHPFWFFPFPTSVRRTNLPRDTPKATCLLEGNETGRVGGTNTGTTVLDGLAVWLLAICKHLFPYQIQISEGGRTMRWRTRQGSGQPFRA